MENKKSDRMNELDKKIEDLWQDNPELWEKIKNQGMSDLSGKELVEMLRHLTKGMFNELRNKAKSNQSARMK